MLGRFSYSLSYSWSCSLNSSFVFTWVACPQTFFEQLLPARQKLHNCCYCTVALISHASKVMLKILQSRLQQYVNCELPDVEAGFRKGRGTRDHIANICWMMEKAREFQKNIYFCFIDYAKTLTAWITINCGKFWKRWEYQTTWPASWETCMQVRKQQLELDMEQQTGSK